jgi:PTH1 family peptidyl-tRNA hydrolase
MIKLIVGLGNPGEEYKNTRHNAGYMAVDAFAKKFGFKNFKTRHLSEIATGRFAGKNLILAKPLTYMNNSGLAVENILEEEGIEPSEMVVVYDDIDLPLGTTRLRMRGSSGGHKGMDSIISAIKTSEFPRLKLGIGRPQGKGDVVKWVLSPFEEEEMPTLRTMIEKAIRCLERLILLGPQEAMELCNKNN